MRRRGDFWVVLAWALMIALAAMIDMAHAAVTHNSVSLRWVAVGDDSLTGRASQYDLRYSTAPLTEANFASAPRWNTMPLPSDPGQMDSTVVTGLNPSTTYYFAIKTADEVPNWSGISNVYQVTTLADAIRPARVITLGP